MYCACIVCATNVLFTNILEAVIFPTREILPELYIDPVKIRVSAFTEKA